MMKKSNYFVVNDIRVASIMSKLLGVDFYAFYSEKMGKDVYTFPRTENIEKIYGRAIKIAKDL